MQQAFQTMCQFVKAEPFQPFTIEVVDGSRYRVRDRSGIYVAHDLVVLGRDRGKDGIFERGIHINPINITDVKPLKSNGSHKRKR